MSGNMLPFLLSTVRMLADTQVTTWVFGGWAEELWQISAPRPHTDVDFLYPANDFAYLDGWIAATADITEIAGKRFSHKRAVVYQHVMIEFLLLQGGDGWRTSFFGGLYMLDWPADTLLHTIAVEDCKLHVASPAALQGYRQQHTCVERAYRAYAQDRAESPPGSQVSC
jgi:hypothetical protein